MVMLQLLTSALLFIVPQLCHSKLEGDDFEAHIGEYIYFKTMSNKSNYFMQLLL